MWFILDKKNNVVCSLGEECDNLEIITNAHKQIEVPDDQFEDWMYGAKKYRKGKLVDERTFTEKRKLEYPDIGDQLDAIWDQLEELGITNDNTKKIKKVIDSIKANHPKK